MASKAGYFCLHDIVATQEKVSSKFDVKVHKLGFLDPSTGGDDILPNTKLDLPFWLAQGLKRRHVVQVDIPKVYREGYRDILQADATVIDLHKYGPKYYDFGSYLAKMGHDDSEEIGKCLIQCFKERVKKIMDSSYNQMHSSSSDFVQKLDDSEKDVFKTGQVTSKNFEDWQNRDLEKITMSELVHNHKKRKRTDD